MRVPAQSWLVIALLTIGCSPDPVPLPMPMETTGGPLVYGTAALQASLSAAGRSLPFTLATADDAGAAAALAQSGLRLASLPESFAVVPTPGKLWLIGRDPTGALYAALEVAEAVDQQGPGVLDHLAAHVEAPQVPLRGANLFLALPDVPGTDQDGWWFLDKGFWHDYLDLLARARIDYLDLHGMYNPQNTIFPNALLYFATSPSYPQVGVPADQRAANLAMLQTLVTMAAQRGVRVGLMTYRSDTSPLGDGQGPVLDDAALQTYTREAAADLARHVPGLWRLGFRTGESGHDADWYTGTFVAGVRAAQVPGGGPGIATRTWLSSKDQVLRLAAAAPGLLIESKYNGEHLGPPYVIAGGEMAKEWGVYSYEDYLAPPTPYTFVFQVRAGGTHRIFRQASYARAQRAAGTFTMGRSQGLSLEAPHAYFPQRDFYHAAADRYAPWPFRRDELMYLLYGRLAYDPRSAEDIFRGHLRQRAGADGDALWDAVQAASDIVPWIQTAHTCGPDQRDFAPELESGGSVAYWSGPAAVAASQGPCGTGYQGPFDTFAVAGADDLAADVVAGQATARVTPLEVAQQVLEDARQAHLAVAGGDNAEARDVARECQALGDLGDYFGHKLRAAAALAVYRRTGSADYLAAARDEAAAAVAGWTALAQDTAYIAPFREPLRMAPLGYPLYHWRLVGADVAGDGTSIDQVAAQVQAQPPDFTGTLPAAREWLDAPRAAGPGLAGLSVAPSQATAQAWTVTARLGEAAAGAQVQLYWKPMSGDADWQAVSMSGGGDTFTASVSGGGAGGLFAVEVRTGAGAWRYPDPLVQTPYVVLAP